MKKATSAIIILLLAVMIFTGCTHTNTGDITFVLDWTPNTNHTGVYVALDKGFFEKEGLKVEIIQPSDGTAEQLVAANTAQFGVSYQENVTFARAQGMPLVSIAAVIQHNSSGFISLKSENIMNPADFSGKKYGGWGTEIESTTVKYLMEQNGADPNSVEIITMGDTDFFASSYAGEIDFAWVFEAWTLMEARLRNVDVNYFEMAGFDGVFDYYTPVLITNENNINNNKDIVGKFMRAVTQGYQYTIRNPEEAAGILLKYAPELNKELVMKSQGFLADKYQDDADYWGQQKHEVWENYTKWLMENGFLDEMIIVEDAYTNAFLK